MTVQEKVCKEFANSCKLFAITKKMNSSVFCEDVEYLVFYFSNIAFAIPP